MDDHIRSILAAAERRQAERAAFLASIRTPEGIVGFHGAAEAFEVFDPERIGTGSDGGFLGRGFYFGDEDTAWTYATDGGVILRCALRIDNPYLFEVRDRFEYRNHDYGGLPDPRDIRGGLTARGHDGVIVRHFPAPEDGDRTVRVEIAVWHPEQIRVLEAVPAARPAYR